MKTKRLAGIFIFIILADIALVMGLGGCSSTAQLLAKPKAMGTGVFTEVKDGQPAPKGSVDLVVKASFKTPTHEHYLLESRTPPPTEGGYPFELNIDGQEIIWKVEGKIERTPVSGEHGRLPEGGEGIRYVLEKKIRVTPGFHHVVFGLPYENYYTEVKVSLKEDEPHTLEFKPIYETSLRGYRTFHRGIKSYSAFLDGTQIR